MEDGRERKKIRIEKHLDVGQVATFLRSLADALEGRGASCLEQFGLDLADFTKLKVGLKKGDTGEIVLNLKVRERGGARKPKKAQMPGSSIEQETSLIARREEDPGYSKVKRRLKTSWADIGRQLAAGALPSAAIVADFAGAAEEMILFPGYGDPGYAAFAAACEELQNNFAAADIAAMAQTYARIGLLKKDCHGRFK